LVLADIPEGWTVVLLTGHLTRQQLTALEKLKLQPGDVCEFDE
jgi:hypothetical protein